MKYLDFNSETMDEVHFYKVDRAAWNVFHYVDEGLLTSWSNKQENAP